MKHVYAGVNLASKTNPLNDSEIHLLEHGLQSLKRSEIIERKATIRENLRPGYFYDGWKYYKLKYFIVFITVSAKRNNKFNDWLIKKYSIIG